MKLIEYPNPPEHPGKWLKETFKGDRTYYKWLVEDVNERYDPETHNINPQYHVNALQKYLNGSGGLDWWKARVLAAAIPISLLDLMKKHAEWQTAMIVWNFTHYNAKVDPYHYCSDLKNVPEYTPVHHNYRPTF